MRNQKNYQHKVIGNTINVRKTKKLLIVDNSWLPCSMSSEIIAQVVIKLQKENVAQILVDRIGFENTPLPVSEVLEKEFYPNENKIVLKITEMI